MTDLDRPVASIVVPMLDELGFIEACLDGFAAQTHPLDRLEVLVVDGGSTDGSRPYVEGRMAAEPWIRIVENPGRRASSAFNRGIEAAKGDYVYLFSSHGVPDPDFVARSIEVLEETGAAGVGGDYRHEGLDPTSNAVGLAMVSPFGMASPHRFAATRREVDTISHPGYRIDAVRSIDPFDETLERNSDYEFNWRLRQAGYRLVNDPTVGSVYRPRGSVKALSRQFWHYGRWKVRVMKRHRGSFRLRHLVAPAAVAGAALSPLLALHPTGRKVVAAGGALYLAGVTAAVVAAHPRQHGADARVLFVCFPVMHASWGAGFLASLIEDWVGRGPHAKTDDEVVR